MAGCFMQFWIGSWNALRCGRAEMKTGGCILCMNKNIFAFSGGRHHLLQTLFFCFSDAELDMNGMASDHNISSQEEYLPHYLQKEDPFASKLSREADIIAGFYLTVIGNDFLIRFWNMTMSLHPCRHSQRRQKLLCIRCVIKYFFILERKI